MRTHEYSTMHWYAKPPTFGIRQCRSNLAHMVGLA